MFILSPGRRTDRTSYGWHTHTHSHMHDGNHLTKRMRNFSINLTEPSENAIAYRASYCCQLSRLDCAVVAGIGHAINISIYVRWCAYPSAVSTIRKWLSDSYHVSHECCYCCYCSLVLCCTYWHTRFVESVNTLFAQWQCFLSHIYHSGTGSFIRLTGFIHKWPYQVDDMMKLAFVMMPIMTYFCGYACMSIIHCVVHMAYSMRFCVSFCTKHFCIHFGFPFRCVILAKFIDHCGVGRLITY